MSVTVGQMYRPKKIPDSTVHARGVIPIYMTGGGGCRRTFLGCKFGRSAYFWVKPDLSRFCRSKNMRNFLKSIFKRFFCGQWIRKIPVFMRSFFSNV